MTPQPRTAREAILARIPALLEQHAGHAAWGVNNGSLDDVLRAWQLDPTNFMESLLSWGYTIEAEAAAPLRAALEAFVGLMDAVLPTGEWERGLVEVAEQARAALAQPEGEAGE